eukprot:365237-Chlamydomonas_euryale.AAC.3
MPVINDSGRIGCSGRMRTRHTQTRVTDLSRVPPTRVRRDVNRVHEEWFSDMDAVREDVGIQDPAAEPSTNQSCRLASHMPRTKRSAQYTQCSRIHWFLSLDDDFIRTLATHAAAVVVLGCSLRRLALQARVPSHPIQLYTNVSWTCT